MTSPALAALQIGQKLRKLKSRYEKSADLLAAMPRRSRKKLITALKEWHTIGVEYFNAYEDSVHQFALLEVDKNNTVYNNHAKDAANILAVIIAHYETLIRWASGLGMDYVEFAPTESAFEDLQRLVSRTNPGRATEAREVFHGMGLPTVGFDSEELESPAAGGPAEQFAKAFPHGATFNAPVSIGNDNKIVDRRSSAVANRNVEIRDSLIKGSNSLSFDGETAADNQQHYGQKPATKTLWEMVAGWMPDVVKWLFSGLWSLIKSWLGIVGLPLLVYFYLYRT